MSSRQIFSPDAKPMSDGGIRVKLRSAKLRAYGYPSDYYVRYLPAKDASEILGAIRTIADDETMTAEQQERAAKRLLCDFILCDSDGAPIFAGNYETVYSLPMSVANDMIMGWVEEFAVTGVDSIPFDQLSEAVRDSIGEEAKKKSEPTTSSPSTG